MTKKKKITTKAKAKKKDIHVSFHKTVQTLPTVVLDISALSLEALIELAGRECSCDRVQKGKGELFIACLGSCSHAKALQELSERGIVT